MIVGINLSVETNYHSTHDSAKPGEAEATVWKLGTLDSRVIGKLKDDATSFAVNPGGGSEEEVGVSIGQNDLHYMACRFGLKGWTNFKDSKGNDIRFRTTKKNFGGRTYECVTDEALAQVPQIVVSELGAQILKLNEVSATEEKE